MISKHVCRNRKLKKSEILLFLVIISSFLIQSVAVLKTSNLVIDEPAVIAIGHYFIKDLDTSMFIFHPPLSPLLGGVLTHFLDVDLSRSYEDCTDVGYYSCSQEMFFESGNDAERIGILARIPFILVSLVLGISIFLFARDLYGVKAAFIALILFSFSPAILAYNTIVFTDVLVTTFIFITIFMLWKLIVKGYTKTRLILTGISLGLALASKFTALFLIPIIIMFFAISAYQKKNRKKYIKRYFIETFLILIIGFGILHSTYFFDFGTVYDSIPLRNSEFIDGLIDNNFKDIGILKNSAKFALYDLKVPMPGYWVGILGQYYIGSYTEFKENYLNGMNYFEGKWYYFFEVLLIKTPIPLILLFFISLFYSIRMLKNGFMNESYIIIPIVIFLGIFVIGNYNLGLRHILPIMPFIFLLSSRASTIKIRDKRHKSIIDIFLFFTLGWYILSAILIMPHYMAYFNEFVGGPKNGHEYLLAANLDMGQDLNKLDYYIKSNNIEHIHLSYHGSFDPSYYGIDYDPLPMESYIPWVPGYSAGDPDKNYIEDCSERQGMVAISVTTLHNHHLINKSCFNWLKNYVPIERIGYTMFIFNVTNQVD